MKWLLLKLIRLYQLTFSFVLGRQCRFMPTCSAYAAEAINRYGAKNGGRLAWKRFCKCHPFSKHHGYDPVPELDNSAFRAINPAKH